MVGVGRETSPAVETENVTQIIATPPLAKERPRELIIDPHTRPAETTTSVAQKEEQRSRQEGRRDIRKVGKKGQKECKEYGQCGKADKGRSINWSGSARSGRRTGKTACGYIQQVHNNQWHRENENRGNDWNDNAYSNYGSRWARAIIRIMEME